MAILRDYSRPGSLSEALDLLADPQVRRVPLAGGTTLVGELETRARPDVEGVVDLRELDLRFIDASAASIHIGAMTTLADLRSAAETSDFAGSMLTRAARFEGPVNLRTFGIPKQ